MKATFVLPVVLAVAGAVGLGFYLLRASKDHAPAPATGSVTAGPAPDRVAAAPPLAVRPAAVVPADGVAPAEPPPGEDRSESVTVERGDTIATVNGVAITGADLIAFRAGDGDEQVMTPAMYEFMTTRAIQRELTLQAAKARKLELTAAQRAELEQVRKNAEERGVTDAAQLAFEEDEARAQLLLRSMVEAEGGSPLLADDAAVDRYLEDHAADYSAAGNDPAAQQQLRVDIRQKLYGELAAKYDERLRALLARLEREARVTRD